MFGFASKEAKETLKSAARVREEIGKIVGITDQESLEAALGAKKDVLEARAAAISRGHTSAVKVFDIAIARINKYVEAYNRSVRS